MWHLKNLETGGPAGPTLCTRHFSYSVVGPSGHFLSMGMNLSLYRSQGEVVSQDTAAVISDQKPPCLSSPHSQLIDL